MPAADNGVDDAVTVGRPMATMAHRQLINPIGIDLVCRIEVGTAAQLIRLPCVDDLRLVVATGGGNTLSLGCPIQRFRKGVIQRALQAVTESLLQGYLQSVIAGVTDGAPGVEGGILVVIKAIGRILMTGDVESGA